MGNTHGLNRIPNRFWLSFSDNCGEDFSKIFSKVDHANIYIQLNKKTIFKEDKLVKKFGIDHETSELWLTKHIIM